MYDNKALNKIDLLDYLEDLIQDLLDSCTIKNTIQAEINSNIDYIPPKDLIPITLIINELFSNSIKRKLQMDATVADQYITFPTDSKLLNSGRKQAEKMLDSLFKLNGGTDIKPRTYRHVLHKYFLNYSKKRNQSKASHRKMNRKLLEALERNLKHIDNFLDQFEKQKMHFPFRGATQKNALGTSYPLWATTRNV